MFIRLFQIAIITCIAGVVEGQCSAPADVIIAIPSAWTIPHDDFVSFENNLIELMYYLDIHPALVNIGLLRYGDVVTVKATPQPFKSREQVNTQITLLIQRTPSDGSSQNLAGAIDAMDKMANEPAKPYPKSIPRNSAMKIGVLFIDGNSSEAQGVLESATNAKFRGMHLFTIVAVGNGTYGPTAAQIVSHYCHFFQVKTFSEDLPYLVPMLAKAICSELDKFVLGRTLQINWTPGKYEKTPLKTVTCEPGDNIMKPDPNNCAYYYICDNYVPIRQACAPDTIFDPNAKICNFADRVACVSDLECLPGDNQLLPHPHDCQLFINCDQALIPHVLSCPPYTLFDPEWQTCNVTSKITCILPRV